MLNVSKNQHRWKKSLDENNHRALEGAAETLVWAWKTDMETPKSYPLNTNYAFSQLKKRIRDIHHPSRSRTERKLSKLPPPPPPPKRFSELIDEKTIRAVYEDQNTGRYGDALKLAARGDHAAFRRILNDIGQAYLIDYFGLDATPKPRVHFLHRNLLEIADLLDLGDLNHAGIVEFLDDLCPCRRTHRIDAIRKLRKRLASVSTPKS
jgi:hypothetical protein